jgi:hypothetical protein
MKATALHHYGELDGFKPSRCPFNPINPFASWTSKSNLFYLQLNLMDILRSEKSENVK